MQVRKVGGWLAAFTLVGGLLGCGGGGTDNGGGDSIELSGGLTTLIKTDTPAIPATTTEEGTPTTYTTTIGGVTKTISIVATPTAFPAGTPIAVLPDAIPIINGSFTRAPGDLVVTCFDAMRVKTTKTKYSKIVTASNGNLVINHPIGLTPGQYYGSVEGPIYFAAANGKTLTVGSMGFLFEVDAKGVCSFPTSISGSLPANGGSTKPSNIKVVTTSNTKFAGGAAGLILESDNFYMTMGAFVGTDGKCTFKSSNGGFTVPAGGIGTVQFSIYGPVPE